MTRWAIAALLLLPSLAMGQGLPFISPDASLQENFEWLANQGRQNKAAITNVGIVAAAYGGTVTVNGSMIGTGSLAVPVGVNSSSAAVLGSTGYVLNQQLDPSSVTKQGFVTLANLTGQVPTAGIAALAVDTGKIATDAVITAKILNGAVDTTKLATDSVTGTKILNATIDTAKLNATIQAQLGQISGKVSKTGDTMTGLLTVSSDTLVTGQSDLGDVGGVTVRNVGAGAGTIGFNSRGNAGSTYVSGVTGYGGLLQMTPTTGLLTYYAESNATAGNAHSHITAWGVDNAGNFGIKNAAPATVLDVTGNAQFGTTVKSTFSTTGDLSLASNADLTLTGPTAYATFPASVTASAYYGYGGNLTGISAGGGSVSVGTGTLTTGTTVTATMPIVGFDGAYFSAQTDSTHAQTLITFNAGTLAVSASTKVAVANSQTFTQTTFGADLACATMTVSGRGKIYATFIGNAGHASTFGRVLFNVKVDQVLQPPWDGGTNAILTYTEYTADSADNASFSRAELPVPSAGSHAFCLTARVLTGTGKVGYESTNVMTFLVEEAVPPAIIATQGSIGFVSDNLLASANGVTKAFTLSQVPSTSTAIEVYLDGLRQFDPTDYTYSATANQITLTTAPASNSSQFTAYYAINTSTLPGVAVYNATGTFSGSNKFTSTTTMVANFFAFAGQQTSNTNDSAHATTYSTRTINTNITNVEGVCTLATNVISCPAGTYRCRACDCFENTGAARVALWDSSAGTVLGRSPTVYANTANETQYVCTEETRFTKASAFTMVVMARAAGVSVCIGNNYAEAEQYAYISCYREN